MTNNQVGDDGNIYQTTISDNTNSQDIYSTMKQGEAIIRADERAKVLAEVESWLVDEIDLLLAMIQSTTEDTPHSEMIEMVEKVRAELREKLAEMKNSIKQRKDV